MDVAEETFLATQGDFNMRTVRNRTVEEERRYRDFVSAFPERVFTDAELEEQRNLGRLNSCPYPSTVVPPISPAPLPPPRITVSVRRVAHGYNPGQYEWKVSVRVGDANKVLPLPNIIRACINPEHKHFLPARVSNRIRRLGTMHHAYIEALEAGLPPQSLHDALRIWAVASEAPVPDIESSTPLGSMDEASLALLRSQPATLEIGGMIYRLAPVEKVDARPLVARVRAKALAGAQIEATSIVQRARVDARTAVSDAESRLSDVRLQIESARRSIIPAPPDWVVQGEIPHLWDGGRWSIKMSISCQVKAIRYTVSHWHKILFWEPLKPFNREDFLYKKMPVWVRLGEGGTYSLRSVYMEGEGYGCTHISGYCCMALQGLPPKLDCIENYRRLVDCLGRGMEVVNMNSPLSVRVSEYWPMFKDQLPPSVISYLTGQVAFRDNTLTDEDGEYPTLSPEAFRRAYPNFSWDREETISEEISSTFRVREDLPEVDLAAMGVNPIMAADEPEETAAEAPFVDDDEVLEIGGEATNG